MITQAIKQEVNKAIDKKFKHTPVFANKKVCADILGISPKQVDALITQRVLEYRKHFSKWTITGNNVYYMPQIIHDLKPEKAEVMPFFEGVPDVITDKRETKKDLYSV